MEGSESGHSYLQPDPSYFRTGFTSSSEYDASGSNSETSDGEVEVKWVKKTEPVSNPTPTTNKKEKTPSEVSGATTINLLSTSTGRRQNEDDISTGLRYGRGRDMTKNDEDDYDDDDPLLGRRCGGFVDEDVSPSSSEEDVSEIHPPPTSEIIQPISEPNHATCPQSSDPKTREQDEEKSIQPAGTHTNSDPLQSWNPMQEQYFSKLNYAYDVSDDEPEIVTLLGATVCKVLVCKFNNPATGTCWKGYMCPYAHPIGGIEIPLPEPPVVWRASLTQKPVLGGKRAQVSVTVVHINDPLDFYVVANGDAYCVCRQEREEEHEDGAAKGFGSEKKSSLELIADMSSRIGMFMSLKISKFQTDHYDVDQLVACRVYLENKPRQWCRAIVLEKTRADVTLKVATIPVQLLDYGVKLEVPFVYCASLPLRFTVQPPLAYHCKLFGVQPLCGNFTETAMNFFKEFSAQKDLLMDVKEPAYAHDQQRKDYIFEDPPYYVDLRHVPPRTVTMEEEALRRNYRREKYGDEQVAEGSNSAVQFDNQDFVVDENSPVLQAMKVSEGSDDDEKVEEADSKDCSFLTDSDDNRAYLEVVNGLPELNLELVARSRENGDKMKDSGDRWKKPFKKLPRGVRIPESPTPTLNELIPPPKGEPTDVIQDWFTRERKLRLKMRGIKILSPIEDLKAGKDKETLKIIKRAERRADRDIKSYIDSSRYHHLKGTNDLKKASLISILRRTDGQEFNQSQRPMKPMTTHSALDTDSAPAGEEPATSNSITIQMAEKGLVLMLNLYPGPSDDRVHQVPTELSYIYDILEPEYGFSKRD